MTKIRKVKNFNHHTVTYELNEELKNFVGPFEIPVEEDYFSILFYVTRKLFHNGNSVENKDRISNYIMLLYKMEESVARSVVNKVSNWLILKTK